MNIRFMLYILTLLIGAVLVNPALAQQHLRGILPEQRCLQIRSPDQLVLRRMPRTPPPATVSDPQWDATPINASLSEVLNLSLENLDVIRVLTGASANFTGQTIYDVAIANTAIDSARGAFDPNLIVNNDWSRADNPLAVPDLNDPTQAQIVGNRSNRHNLNFGLSKRTLTGGIIDFGVIGGNRFFPNLATPLNPQTDSATALQMTQPLLQGAGRAVNRAPIVIATIETERSFFQFKDAMQVHVESIVQGYWELVLARTELWAREQQVRQLEFALKRAEDRVEIGDARLGDLSQARVAYENFRASLLIAQGNLLQRESALRNVLGLSPFDHNRIIPTSPLIDEKLTFEWEELLSLAECYRPDIIELKLILEADQQRLLLRNNEALPQLDSVALYRWNGLQGTMPNGANTSGTGFDDWSLGVNFSVPLGLRTARAGLRQQELLIERDEISLRQGLHQASHNLAIRLRNLELFYAQYERFRDVRRAAKENLEQQIEIGNELEQFIVLLQAIVDWGNAVSSEAQALVQYNSELAALERETGTILESHGITFVEERFGSIGPLGRRGLPVAYPTATHPVGSVERYSGNEKPSELQFELVDPLEQEDENSPQRPDFESIPAEGNSNQLKKPQELGQTSFHSRAKERFKSLFRNPRPIP